LPLKKLNDACQLLSKVVDLNEKRFEKGFSEKQKQTILDTIAKDEDWAELADQVSSITF
jgi:hypothetical protein